ncbi:carbohydrate ABC transporter permease [Cohnella nanjingensis]|uniref:Maltose/maltodextrin transport system permease protein n=1 Tax=Cohnella nanjingensis TaxID=1387779 RepID=A0A7X0RMF8_9BACL|nr:sugar ABC transporter permease [Cohnella nanjingensis]MBB6670160.1 sugar ABC transporter permease [Cohnella nanjingensis]
MRRMSLTASVLSLIAPGLGQLYNRQFIKGVLFLAIDALGLWYFINHLPRAVWGIVTLGTQKQHMEKVGKITKMVPGDHSIHLLVQGLIILILFMIFAWFYVQAVIDARRNGLVRENGGQTVNFYRSAGALFDRSFPFTMLAVPIVGILFLTIMPIIFGILIAFTNFSGPNFVPPNALVDWVGFRTFTDLLTLKTWSYTFWHVLLWTVEWALLATVTTYLGGMLVAMLVQQPGIRFKKFWRTLFIVPFAIPQLCSALIMNNLFNGEFGPINQYLGMLGIEKIGWLTDPQWAKFTVVLVNAWFGIPVTMMLMFGVLTTIPKDLYEAAEVDGATAFQKFRTITLPRVLFVTAPVLITQFAGNINNFNAIYLLTGGDPKTGDYQFAGQTDLLVTWLYKLTLDNNKYNFASAIGIIVFLIIASISIASYLRTKSFKEEDMVQ